MSSRFLHGEVGQPVGYTNPEKRPDSKGKFQIIWHMNNTKVKRDILTWVEREEMSPIPEPRGVAAGCVWFSILIGQMDEESPAKEGDASELPVTERRAQVEASPTENHSALTTGWCPDRTLIFSASFSLELVEPGLESKCVWLQAHPQIPVLPLCLHHTVTHPAPFTSLH